MTVVPQGTGIGIEIGDEQVLFNKRGDRKSYLRYGLRVACVMFVFVAIICAGMCVMNYIVNGGTAVYALAGILAGLYIIAMLAMFLPPKAPNIAYFVTTGRIGMANNHSYGYYEYADVANVKLRKSCKSVTLKGFNGPPFKIDLHLGEAYDRFVEEIVPKLTNARVIGR